MNEKCFALHKGMKCGALASGNCGGNYTACPFYKPKWKADQDYQKSLALIAQKPPDIQKYIADKYYNGRMPWHQKGLDL